MQVIHTIFGDLEINGTTLSCADDNLLKFAQLAVRNETRSSEVMPDIEIQYLLVLAEALKGFTLSPYDYRMHNELCSVGNSDSRQAKPAHKDI